MDGPAGLHQPQEVEGRVQRALVRLAEEEGGTSLPVDGFQDVPFLVQLLPQPLIHPAPRLGIRSQHQGRRFPAIL